MQLTFASYNIHKAVGLDRRRDPERILAVLHEIDADVVALQEADRRFGKRESALPLQLLDDLSHYRAVPLNHRPDSIGWHGNALLVKRGIRIVEAGVVPLPTIEPRGAVRADLLVEGRRIRVVGMHLDLSGLRRRQQIRAILAHAERCGPACPTVMMGDLNEWSFHAGSLHEFHAPWRVLAPGRSFPARRPVAQLDRIVISAEWELEAAAVHHSVLAARASDHLPVLTRLKLPVF
ncbi:MULTISPECIES: endonuclease/exonuclease/phosphatase family protein [unclassified Novosphingobium]|uniref:endonuclease/exonuclease/phosphatase family protein n=1 Tax=unclassified Novosphingobium TaxID=2644732 RepID=UPI000ECD9766|nr:MULTISPECIES: endonuclease/exonuclease/phosphatase family protein [unclassified Novosphingobium]HCF24179.1 endonuclease [Novosphingobium sp.]HQV02128.1 endonuclease/exonuclease/phosphatase family protein [Novosphingobium sp.]